MGYTMKLVREINIPVIIQYQSHTPGAKKNICPLDAEVAASSWIQCDTAETAQSVTRELVSRVELDAPELLRAPPGPGRGQDARGMVLGS